MTRHNSFVRGILRALTAGLAAVLALGLLAGPAHGQNCKADPAWFGIVRFTGTDGSFQVVAVNPDGDPVD